MKRKIPTRRKNIWPFDGPKATRGGNAIPASGGIAAHGGRRPAAEPKPASLKAYRGYSIKRTPAGEYFSSLDPNSWYESLPALKRAIDGHKKGRAENPGARYYVLVRESADKRWRNSGEGPWKTWEDAEDFARLEVGVDWKVAQGPLAGALRDANGRSNPGRRRNPEAAAIAMSESFHGRPVEEILQVGQKVHYHSHLAELGKLRQLRVLTRDGSITRLDSFAGALLCSNEDGSQLYIMGGDQSVKLSDFAIRKPYHDYEDLGEVIQIDYFTTKEHLGDEGGKAVYFHHFGEEDPKADRRRPRLRYSTRDSLLSFLGGGYIVKPEGIKN